MFIYILFSPKTNRYYIGSTGDLEKRLKLHNAGLTKSTKYGIPWKIIYSEEYSNRKDAVKREKEIKSYKSGNAFKKLLGGVA